MAMLWFDLAVKQKRDPTFAFLLLLASTISS